MARAETIESVGETGGGGGGGGGGNPPLPHHNSCGMELPRPLHTWPGLLATTTITTSTGAVGIHHHSHHHLHPLQALYLSYPLSYPHPEGRDESHSHQQFPVSSPSPTPPPSPLCNRRGERIRGTGAPSDFSGEQSDLGMEASSRQGPLPDLLPQNEQPSRASPHHRAPRGGEAVQEMEVRRVANQLRVIGDEFNIIVLRRAHIAPHWQNWRDVCRGLLNFIAQTLSPLYRLT
ncbi:bcl-2-binding component 3 [Parambassis ranga]|uniref:Bcl-2-binding component 3 n=1 Tax=Parambassis ranga TaxID=210632 RepID=A0A6P7JG29_9TELE|nr:uncharacterized protein LOC114444417 [Parambassis ranga]